jgi:hypothetical protein
MLLFKKGSITARLTFLPNSWVWKMRSHQFAPSLSLPEHLKKDKWACWHEWRKRNLFLMCTWISAKNCSWSVIIPSVLQTHLSSFQITSVLIFCVLWLERQCWYVSVMLLNFIVANM